jgi:glycosyltransferase Alg8
MQSFRHRLKDLFFLFTYLTCLLIAFLLLPKTVLPFYAKRTAFISLGLIGSFRYGWWLVHVIRSLLYKHLIFPKRRLQANRLWASGWRPKCLFFMITTFKELPSTTKMVLKTILAECHEIGVPTKLFIGTGCESDELIIKSYILNEKIAFPLDLAFVRQQLSGKRFAIGGTLKSMIVHGLQADDPVIFMDGDTYLEPGCLRLCLPFFPLFPSMQALTTHERAIIHNGPLWLKKWLELRFAQRDFTMKSYSLSNKVLTLTGRMSIFRGKHILEPEFIEIIENDQLKHWLWGQFRFLSGDDKSTWYYLLKARADMLYIPDATTITIEYIQGSAWDRMKENLRRWSGNTLRNGERAIALGPRKIGFFIWWCLIDQRISIWTMFIGHTIILMLAITKSLAFLFAALLWIALSRLVMSSVLFYHARRIDMGFPFLLYCNQLINSLIKIYILFRLPQQRWKNRGNQSAGFERSRGLKLREWAATYLTAFYCAGFFLLILLYLGIVSWPSLSDLTTLGLI